MAPSRIRSAACTPIRRSNSSRPDALTVIVMLQAECESFVVTLVMEKRMFPVPFFVVGFLTGREGEAGD